ncbi:uncharacterized protein LOC134215927 [Armigeres subalbatus]|uniref:uncharacterized protein LOC134215927 n=1 Tax=Armigeres subalbatus TaxID=124917 RepID=UPI002ED47AB9
MSHSSQHQCIICNQPNEADRKMVQCDVCDRWYHFMCAGVNDSIENESRNFICTACHNSDPCESVASTTTSARAARLELEMQRLAEEKRLQDKMREEREKQDREMQDMVLRLESERREKAITAMFALEKEYIKKKYNLLQTKLDEGSATGSVRSRRNCDLSTSKVQDWIDRNPTVTLSSNTGCIPTGLTLQAETTSDSVQPTSTTTTTAAGTSQARMTAVAVCKCMHSLCLRCGIHYRHKPHQ